MKVCMNTPMPCPLTFYAISLFSIHNCRIFNLLKSTEVQNLRRCCTRIDRHAHREITRAPSVTEKYTEIAETERLARLPALSHTLGGV